MSPTSYQTAPPRGVRAILGDVTLSRRRVGRHDGRHVREPGAFWARTATQCSTVTRRRSSSTGRRISSATSPGGSTPTWSAPTCGAKRSSGGTQVRSAFPDFVVHRRPADRVGRPDRLELDREGHPHRHRVLRRRAVGRAGRDQRHRDPAHARRQGRRALGRPALPGRPRPDALARTGVTERAATSTSRACSSTARCSSTDPSPAPIVLTDRWVAPASRQRPASLTSRSTPPPSS